MDTQLLRRQPGRRALFPDGSLPVRLRLSILMLLIYAAPGAVVPIFSLRLAELGFSPLVIGLCCATQALGTMLAPLLAGQIADRWVAPERCLSVLAVIQASLLWLLGTLNSPEAVFACNLFFWLMMAPALTLSTATAFAHLKNPGTEFGSVRLWGTVGWVIPMWLLGWWLGDSGAIRHVMAYLRPENPHAVLADAFRLASVLALLLGLYALTLPATRPKKNPAGWAAPLTALRVLRGRAFYIYALCTFGVCVVFPFSTQLTPLLLKQEGVSSTWLPRLLTVAQISEVVSLALLPWILHRLGTRWTMVLGLGAALATTLGLMIGQPLALVIAGYSLYGLCICCYLVAGQMDLNRRSQADVRASAQAMHSVLCGAGQLIGNVLVGAVQRYVDRSFTWSFAVAGGIAAMLLLIFLVGFPGDRRR